MVLQYYSWFFLGYFIFNQEEKIHKISFNVLLLLTFFLTIMTIIFRQNVLFINNCFKYFCAICWLMLIYKLSYKIKTNKIISYISYNSFGIYLFHSPLIYITFSTFANSNPIIVIFINFIFFSILSIFLTEFIRITKIKFIIGE